MTELDEYKDSEGLGKWIESSKHRQIKQCLYSAIQAMNGRQREVFELFLQNKTFDEIAAILNLTKGAVYTYYRRGIKAIKKLVK